MDYMTLKQASDKWGISPRMINYYCLALLVRKRWAEYG